MKIGDHVIITDISTKNWYGIITPIIGEVLDFGECRDKPFAKVNFPDKPLRNIINIYIDQLQVVTRIGPPA